MIRRRAVEGAGLALVFALGTWYGGWWVIPPGAALWQLVRRHEPSWLPALSAGIGWAALLLLLPLGPLDRLDSRLSGMLFLPPLGATGITLLFPALLGWSSARLIRAVRPSPQV